MSTTGKGGVKQSNIGPILYPDQYHYYHPFEPDKVISINLT